MTTLAVAIAWLPVAVLWRPQLGLWAYLLLPAGSVGLVLALRLLGSPAWDEPLPASWQAPTWIVVLLWDAFAIGLTIADLKTKGGIAKRLTTGGVR
jgi:hypothetical protein